MSITLLVFPRTIARIYTIDQTVIGNAITLLAAGAAFQLLTASRLSLRDACAAQETRALR